MSAAFVEADTIAANTLIVLCMHRAADFAVLQSRVHEAWARFLGSSMKDDMRYTTQCFDTFPRPPDAATLEAVGSDYYGHRAALMVANNEGLTKTYNRFHDPNERSPAIQKLRELHAEMDRAVLDAYGWTDLKPVYDFRVQLDESVRLTWDDDTRDEVLARLLELNRVRYEEEQKNAPKPEPKKRAAKKKGGGGPTLPGMGDS